MSVGMTASVHNKMEFIARLVLDEEGGMETEITKRVGDGRRKEEKQ